jgi:hypothetical protein
MHAYMHIYMITQKGSESVLLKNEGGGSADVGVAQIRVRLEPSFHHIDRYLIMQLLFEHTYVLLLLLLLLLHTYIQQ